MNAPAEGASSMCGTPEYLSPEVLDKQVSSYNCLYMYVVSSSCTIANALHLLSSYFSYASPCDDAVRCACVGTWDGGGLVEPGHGTVRNAHWTSPLVHN